MDKSAEGIPPPLAEYLTSMSRAGVEGTFEDVPAIDHNSIERPFPCPICPKKFTNAYTLGLHVHTHIDEGPFACTVCGKYRAQQHDVCSQCGTAFAQQHDPTRHETLHADDMKFICKGSLGFGEVWGCLKSFANQEDLDRHLRSEAGRICMGSRLREEAMDDGR
ncbi:hypothetical protein F5Y18DRAFT_218979 [Xylariaceae sp. FL1019]|nr:hypothetical protein F5Y18DRAFT_218979 [Xylariaceae sp. FL1019]